MTNDNPRPPAAREWIVALVLFLTPLALYAKVHGHEFLKTYDDGSYVTENPIVRDGLSLEGLAWAFTETHSANWHPLTWLSHMLDCQLFGLDAGKHHLVNVLLHGIACVLCLRALKALSGNLWCSAGVALFFAIHPLRVESVAWIAERKDVLSGVFFFWTLLSYAHFARDPKPRGMWRVALPCALGLMSKPMLVTLPAVLVLLDIWPLGRFKGSVCGAVKGREPTASPTLPSGRTGASTGGFVLLAEKWPLWALAVATALITFLAQRAGGAIRTLESITWEERLANAPLAYIEYLWKSVWPGGFAFYYPHPAIVDPDGFRFASIEVWSAFGALLALTLVILRLVRTRPWLTVGWLWFLGMLVPVIGLLQVGSHRMANRYAYLPLVGIYIAIAWELRSRVTPRAIRPVALVLGATAVFFSARTWFEIDHWHDGETLYERALSVTEKNWAAHNNLGYLLQDRGNRLLASGALAEGRAELERARRHYQSVLAIAPDQSDAHGNLGGLYMTLGEPERAAEELRTALRIRPTFLEARLNLGKIHEQKRAYEKAQEQYERAVADHPWEARAYLKLGDARYEQEDLASATGAYRKALSLDPRLPETQLLNLASCSGLAWILATSADPSMRDERRAHALMTNFERTMGGRLSWSQLRTLAAAQAANGLFDRALESLDRALSRSGARTDLLQADRRAYGAGKPLVDRRAR